LGTNTAISHHHEILLRVRNESGDLVSPQAFIEAAKTYDLMRDVDRWVVDAFFKQLEPFADQLPDGQSFSINHSGKSLEDLVFKKTVDRTYKENTPEYQTLRF
jgi:EAL domain-containing protein (putative c-di-GMP-specific phosphodiesterase class I)